jgi:hypothetical protein
MHSRFSSANVDCRLMVPISTQSVSTGSFPIMYFLGMSNLNLRWQGVAAYRDVISGLFEDFLTLRHCNRAKHKGQDRCRSTHECSHSAENVPRCPHISLPEYHPINGLFAQVQICPKNIYSDFGINLLGPVPCRCPPT